MDTLPLIQHIKSSYRQRHDYAIVATFNADLRFFEQRVLFNLRARNVLFLMDEGQFRLQMQKTDTVQIPKLAGIRYQVAPVSVHNGLFHSKFILCLSEKHSRLIIGSGNMGRPGYMANAEVFSIVESDNDQPDESTALISEACDFLNELAQAKLVAPNIREFIANAISAQPQTVFLSKRQYFLLHSISQPIIDLVAAKLHDQQVTEVHVLSPFMGQGTQLIEDLIVKFNNSSVNIYLQNNRTQFDSGAIASLCRHHPQVKLFEISAPSENRSVNTEQLSERYIHAKLLGFVTPKYSYWLTGSPNFTRAALGLSAQAGNVETTLFTQYASVTDFKKLLKQQFLNIRSIASLDELTPGPLIVWTGKEARPPLKIISAKYDGAHLLIDFLYRDGELTKLRNFHVVYRLHGEDNRVSVALKEPTAGHITIDCDLPVASTIIWLEAQRISDRKDMTSDRQWVFFPQASDFSETGFNQDDFDRCVEIGGIEGVWKALRLASSDEQPDWLIAFLQVWDLGGILESTKDPVANKIPANLAGRGPALPLETRPEYLHRGLEILVRPDLEEVLEDILEKYRKGIVEWLGEAEVESIRIGLQYILVFDLLCLLLMKGFKKLIEKELEKKRVGAMHQYGHARVVTHRFISYYLYDWQKFLEKGNYALGALNERRLPPNIYLFHNASSAIVYTLANKVASQIDLEEPVLFKKVVANLVGAHAKERCSSYLLLSESVETLKGILQNYDLVIKDLGIDLNIEQLRKSLQKLFAPS